MTSFHLSRREFLSRSTALGATIALNPLSGLLNQAEAMLLPRSISSLQILRLGEAHAEFDNGIRLAASAATKIRELRFNRLDQLESHVGKHPGSVIIGIMNDGAFTDFNEGLRLRKADLLCSGSHVGGKDFTRHYFQSTAASQGIGSAFAQVISQRAESSLIRESSFHEVLPTSGENMRALPSFTSWEQGLGYQLSQIGSGNWRPRTVRTSTLLGPDAHSTSTTTHFSFVSFVARI
ncbi:MAG: twin-arginine translocation signal domain-containing protein [Oligoflexia bacterium]|nr:twin-arginine translocation signal domain-containing protein [Oligoflexia bacterium]